MCDDPEHLPAAQMSRRRVLQGMAALAALAGCRPGTDTPRAAPIGSSDAGVLNPYVLAMHLHASASEGVGSVHSHLLQAAAHGFHVAWFTEHDWRRRRLLYRPRYSFLPDERALGGTWTVEPMEDVGSLGPDSGGRLVTTPVSPNDPAELKGSLFLRAVSTGAERAVVRYRIQGERASRENYRSRIAGCTVAVDVLPTVGSEDGWGEVEFALSHHPGSLVRTEGVVSIRYRLRPDITAYAVKSNNGATGVVDVPVIPGRWQTVQFDLVRDVGTVWPDMDPRDNCLHDIEFHALSRGTAPAEVYFGHLRIEERAEYDALGVERELLASYTRRVPEVLGLVGTEISLGPHLNQFGGPQDPYDYGPVASLGDQLGDIRGSIVDFVHAQGGLASINHPSVPEGSDAAAEPEARAIARDLLAIGAGGADVIEVGYGRSGLEALPARLAVFDALARNGLFLTGNGTSDDHSGQNWDSQPNRFYTGAWATGLDERSLLDSMARGRAYVGYLGAFAGTIDMAVDTDVPMGAVSVSPATSRSLRVDVTQLPEGGAVEVIRGDVDYAGLRAPDPNTTTVKTLGARDLASSDEVVIDTTDDCFVRLQVTDRAGAIVAFGQPTWVLKEEPPGGVPPARRTNS
jgi:hypothetical protein